jgi:hypothetical protein
MANEKEEKLNWQMSITANGSRVNKDYPNAGDEIKAIVKKYTGQILSEFILETALEEVKSNNKKIADFTHNLLVD